MTIQFTITIEDTQSINGIEYTETQLLQGLAQIRTQHNQRTDGSLADAQWLQWSYLQNLSVWYEQNKAVAPIVPSPIVPVANWEALCNEILGGSLNGIYTRLTEACFLNPATATIQQIANANNIAVAAGKLDQAVAVTCVEGAVAASFQLVVNTSDYRFTQVEKDLWNAEVIRLNFTPLMQIA